MKLDPEVVKMMLELGPGPVEDAVRAMHAINTHRMGSFLALPNAKGHGLFTRHYGPWKEPSKKP